MKFLYLGEYMYSNIMVYMYTLQAFIEISVHALTLHMTVYNVSFLPFRR